jgi:hypothetical protein
MLKMDQARNWQVIITYTGLQGNKCYLVVRDIYPASGSEVLVKSGLTHSEACKLVNDLDVISKVTES